MNNMGDIMSAIGSVLIILFVIVLAFYASRWYARRMGLNSAGKYVKVLDRTNLGNSSSLVIVQVGEKYYLIGVSDKNVQLVSELPDFETYLAEHPSGAPIAPVSFGKMLRAMMDKSGREKKRDEGGVE